MLIGATKPVIAILAVYGARNTFVTYLSFYLFHLRNGWQNQIMKRLLLSFCFNWIL